VCRLIKGFFIDGHAVHAERRMNRGARGFEVRGQIHAGVEASQELRFVAQVREFLKLRLRGSLIGLSSLLKLDLFQLLLNLREQFFRRLCQRREFWLAPKDRQRFRQFEPRVYPIVRGGGDTSAVE
jgi:hypothetical protein